MSASGGVEDATLGIAVGVGAVAMVAATAVAAVLFPPGDQSALLVVGVAAGGYATTVADTRASLVTAGLGYLLFNGFLVNRYGELTWDGTTSAWHLTVFALAVGLGLGQRWIRHALADLAVDGELNEIIEDEKESHGG